MWELGKGLTAGRGEISPPHRVRLRQATDIRLGRQEGTTGARAYPLMSRPSGLNGGRLGYLDRRTPVIARRLLAWGGRPQKTGAITKAPVRQGALQDVTDRRPRPSKKRKEEIRLSRQEFPRTHDGSHFPFCVLSSLHESNRRTNQKPVMGGDLRSTELGGGWYRYAFDTASATVNALCRKNRDPWTIDASRNAYDGQSEKVRLS